MQQFGKIFGTRGHCFNGRIGSGEILFLNEKINGLKPHQLVEKGLCLVPEEREVFPTMSVLERWVDTHGLSPNYVETVFEKIRKINKSGTTVLLVEQNARMALEYADRGYVFNIGEIALEDTGKDLLENDHVRKSFLAG